MAKIVYFIMILRVYIGSVILSGLMAVRYEYGGYLTVMAGTKCI